MVNLHSKKSLLYLFLYFIFSAFVTQSQNSATSLSINTTVIKSVVDSLSGQILKYYVFKPEAQKMSAYLKSRLQSQAYSNISNPHLLAAQLTNDVRSIHHDEHFHVEYNPLVAHEISGEVEDIPKMVAEKLQQDKSKNFGFKKVEVLNGNIGYIEISSFARLNRYSSETATAALKLVSNSRAIIIDLRYGVGGSPEMVNHIVSHFFKNKTRIIDIEIRSENSTLNYSTNPDSTFTSLHNIPIYILTSYKTFSAAEGLAYELQYLKRATIVGEVTRGGAHTVTYRPLSNGFVADVPFGRAITPITKKNWEITGITPDLKVASDGALELAVKTIFELEIKKAKDTTQLFELRWQNRLWQAKTNPVVIDTNETKKIVGNYGAYTLTYMNQKLYYQKIGKANFELLPISSFSYRPKGNDTFIVEFIKNELGNISNLKVSYDDGRIDFANKLE